MWLFRASDIAHSAKPWPIHRKWSMRVVQVIPGGWRGVAVLGVFNEFFFLVIPGCVCVGGYIYIRFLTYIPLRIPGGWYVYTY